MLNVNVTKKRIGIIVLSALVALMAACASVENPLSDRLVQVESEINIAKQMGAEEHAPLAMNSANENLSDANRHITKSEYKKAKMSLEKATYDVRYAVVKTNATKAEGASSEISDSLKALESETF